MLARVLELGTKMAPRGSAQPAVANRIRRAELRGDELADDLVHDQPVTPASDERELTQRVESLALLGEHRLQKRRVIRRTTPAASSTRRVR